MRVVESKVTEKPVLEADETKKTDDLDDQIEE